MNEKNKKRVELIAFTFLIFGMSVAGYVYQANKDTISKAILIPSIVGSLLFLYGIYLFIVRSMAKK
jgi:hypothetical protein